MKKLMFKSLSFLLIISICVANFSFGAFAEFPVTITIGTVTAEPGDTNVRVPVTITGNPGISDAVLKFEIPTDLILKSFDGIGGMRVDPISNITTKIALLENTTVTGYKGELLLTLVLDVSALATPGTKIISLAASSSLDGPSKNVTIANTFSGGITIPGSNNDNDSVVEKTPTLPASTIPVTTLPANVSSSKRVTSTQIPQSGNTVYTVVKPVVPEVAAVKTRLNKYFINNITVREINYKVNSGKPMTVTIKPDKPIKNRKNIMIYHYDIKKNKLTLLKNTNPMLGKKTGAVRFDTNVGGLLVISDGSIRRK